MGSVEMTSLDLECGSSAVSNDVDGSIRVSKATEGSCSFKSYLAADSSSLSHDSDSEIDQVSHSRRVSSVVAAECVVDIDQNGVDEVRISVEIIENECRICMLSLNSETGSAIELGCSCKNELAAAHQHCAKTWSTSKGSRICEICKSVVQNVVIPNSTRSSQRILEVNRSLTNAVSVLLPEHNTMSANTITVPVSAHNAPSTNAASFQEVRVNTISRSSDLAPISSTSVCDCDRVCKVCEILLICVFFIAGFFIYKFHH